MDVIRVPVVPALSLYCLYIQGVGVAVVKAPALSVEASGNMGPICYSRWRGLKIARGVWTGTYPDTEKQQAVNARMTVVSQAWGGMLTAEEREAWVEAAREQTWKNRLGDDFVPAGYMYFSKVNLLRKFFTYGILTSPPVYPYSVYMDFFSLVKSDAGKLIRGKLEGYIVTEPPDKVQYDKAGPYDSGGRKPIAGEWRFLTKKDAGVQFFDSDLVSEKWYWYRARWFQLPGRVGNWFVKQKQAPVI